MKDARNEPATFSVVHQRSGGDWILACPKCGCHYTHIQRVHSLEGSDPFEGGSEFGELFGVPVGGVTESRRGALVITVWGECSHTFEIQFTDEQGETSLEARLVGRVS